MFTTSWRIKDPEWQSIHRDKLSANYDLYKTQKQVTTLRVFNKTNISLSPYNYNSLS